MALVNTGSFSKFFGAPSPLLSKEVFTLVATYRLKTGFSNGIIFAQLGNRSFASVAGVASFSAKNAAVYRNAGGGTGAESSTTAAIDGNWHTIAGLFTSQPLTGVSVDGSSYVTVGSGGGSPYDSIIVGGGGWAISNSTSTAASVAEVSLWGTELPQPYLQAIYNGVSPLDLGAPLLAYYPLRTDTRDYSGNRNHMMPFGGAKAVYTDHPVVAPSRRRKLFHLVDTGVHDVLATPTTGAAVVTGKPPVSAFGWTATPGKGAVAVTGKQPTVTTFGDVLANPGTDALSVIGFVPKLVGIPIGPPPVVGSGNDPYRPRDPRMRAPFSILRRKTPEVGEQPEQPEYEEIEDRPDDSVTRLAAELDLREAQFQREQAARMMASMVRQASRAQTRDRVRQSAANAKSQADVAASIVRALAAGQIFFGSGE